MGKAHRHIAEMALEMRATQQIVASAGILERKIPAVQELYRMRPHAAHIADQVLGPDRLERAVGGTDRVQLAP